MSASSGVMIFGMMPGSSPSSLPSTWLAEMPSASENDRTVRGSCDDRVRFSRRRDRGADALVTPCAGRANDRASSSSPIRIPRFACSAAYAFAVQLPRFAAAQRRAKSSFGTGFALAAALAARAKAVR